jgi:hypothetical protein
LEAEPELKASLNIVLLDHFREPFCPFLRGVSKAAREGVERGKLPPPLSGSDITSNPKNKAV